MSMKASMGSLVLAAFALAGGAFIGYADSHSDDPAITLLLLGALTFLLGSLGPRKPWLWAVLAGPWVPVLDVALPRLGLAPWDTASPTTLLSSLAVLGVVMAASLAGSYAGAFVGRAARRAAGIKAPSTQ
ncbi:MAG TPA: hypothetical protein VL523_11970 [Terriglobia bacterium]|nr:hypothetical protein [Terriglobia bacterium]